VGQGFSPADQPKEIVSMWGWPDVEPSWLWPGHEGRPIEVDVYSAAERVELFLNGTSLGVRPTSRSTRYMASFTVPYAPGVLRVVGYIGERAIGATELRSPGAPAALRLTVDRGRIAASRNDLAYVTVEVVDRDGVPVPSAAHRIRFDVSGAAELAAVANSNPSDASSYRGATREAWKGRALAIVRPTGRGTGTATLTATTDGLAGGKVTVEVGGEGRGSEMRNEE
jgi:beta-galactosidase